MAALSWAAELSAVTLDLAEATGVATLTLNRPDAANARNQAMREDLGRVLDWAAEGDPVRALVLTGAGSRFFCAGMDLKEARGPETPLQTRERLRRSRDIDQLAELPVPTVAAINGYALGGGLEMALACDLRVASHAAVVGVPEVTHGLVPAGGATQRLPRLVGLARATELVLTGRRVAAAEALDLGLVTEVCAAEDLVDVARTLAETVAARPPAAVRAAKTLLRTSAEVPLSAGLGAELDALVLLLTEQRLATYDDND